MKLLKLTGLIIFIFGFIAFNGLFFLGRYSLTATAVSQRIEDAPKRNTFLAEADVLLGKTYTSSFQFTAALRDVFKKTNEKILQRYRISDDDIDRIVEQTGNTFSLSSLDSVYRTSNETAGFQNKVMRDYSGWLEGREFSSSESLKKELQQVATNINTYGIINQLGFDRYAIKELTFAFTKTAAITPVRSHPFLFLLLSIGLSVAGALLYIFPKVEENPGDRNHNVFFNPMKNTGWLGILTGTYLIGFYILLYFYPEYMTNWIVMVDPLSHFLNGGEASRFFLYGFLYTLCILVMGVRFIVHYRDNNYHIIRTASVMFFQTGFAFLIPEILVRLNKPYYDFKNIWPLDYSFFFDFRINQMIEQGTLGIFMLVWGIVLVVIAVPVLAYFFGKRWYCSWVCGCGGLAETFGDPYRQLSDKRLKAWKIERWLVHGVLVFAVVMTIAVLYTYFSGSSWFFIVDSYSLREVYGAFIGAGFAGVIGTGFYPLMGNRVWCRFGCPLAAYVGIVQRFKSRFRITTNGGQCISCGNCSTYCEMGIDVRWYAQRGQNIVRASCVGCGVCSAVCPRGVLNLEVKDENGRFGKPILIGNNHITLHD